MTSTAFSSIRGKRMLVASAIIAALVIAFLFLMPLKPTMPQIGLDPSWCAALNEAVAKHMVFGRDLVFTFGPLASVYNQTYHPSTDDIMLVFSGLVAAGFCTACALLASPHRHLILLALPVLVAEATFRDPPFDRDAPFLALPIILLLLCLRTSLPKGHALRLAPSRLVICGIAIASSAMATLPLIKGSFSGPVSLAFVLCSAIIASRSRLMALAFALLVVSTTCIAWIAAGQSLTALPAFFVAQAPIIGGYSEAMSVTGPVGAWVAFIVAAAWMLWIFARAVARPIGLAGWFAFAGLACLLFVAFKAGFVRHDQHATIAAGTLLFAGFMIAAISNPRHALLCSLVSICAWGMIEFGDRPGKTREIYTRIATASHDVKNGLGVRFGARGKLDAEYMRSLAEIRTALPLPAVTGTTDVYPYELSTVFAHHLAWSGRPVFQSYSAYSPALAELNASHLRASNAPEHVFVHVGTIDNRVPLMDDGSSWPILLSQRYEIVGYDANFIHFVRRKETPAIRVSPRPTVTLTAELNKAIALPFNGIVWASIDLQPTLLGRIGLAVFKLPGVRIETTLDDGRVISNRYVPAMGHTGFILSPYVDSNDSMMALAAGDANSNAVRAIRILAPARFWGSHFNVQFTRLNLPIQPAVRRMLLTEPTTPPSSVLRPTEGVKPTCHIDLLNGQATTGRSGALAISNTVLNVQGWALINPSKPAPPTSTWIALTATDGSRRFYQAQAQNRPDVLSAYKIQSKENAGFSAKIDVLGMEGVQHLEIYAGAGDNAFKCGIDQALVIRTAEENQ
ncbi:hypothetical protein PQR21_04930 [Paraburkholderia nemoris]|uniref:hypothetical protein n=1 Tax=Paraburkholderia nemoris TaxID=2793076 RepID=UPI0038B9112C